MSSRKPAKISLNRSRSACPISATLDVIGDKWSLLVIRDLLFLGKTQFGELLAASEGISTNILAQRLNSLEACGIVEKQPYQDNPVRYSYTLTRRGRELRPVLMELIGWGNNHINGTYAPTEEDLKEA